MRKISLWARSHRYTARIFIIMIKILLAIMAWFVGRLFSEIDVSIPESTGFFALFIFIVAALLYPSGRRTISSRKYFYLKQKSCDFTLAACTFIMMVSVTNNKLYYVTTPSSYASNNTVISKPPTAEEILASLKYRDKKTLTKPEKKILRQEFKKQLKIFTKATLSGNKKDGDKAGLILLTIIAAVGLTLLLSALVCSLSCGGADGLAVVVALVGLVAIIWGATAIIKGIRRGPRKKPVEIN